MYFTLCGLGVAAFCYGKFVKYISIQNVLLVRYKLVIDSLIRNELNELKLNCFNIF